MQIKCPKCAGSFPFEAGELPQAGLRCTCPTCGKSMHLMPRAAWGAERNPASGDGDAVERLWAAHGLDIGMRSGLTGTPGPGGAYGYEPTPGPTPPAAAFAPPEPTRRTWFIAGVGILLVLIGLAVAAGVVFAGASPPTTLAAEGLSSP